MSKNRKHEIVYMAVSADKYELPAALFLSLREVQVWTGNSYRFVSKLIKNRFTIYGCKIIKMDLKHDKKADT